MGTAPIEVHAYSAMEPKADKNITKYDATGSISNENIVTTRDRVALVFHEYVRNRAWTFEWLSYFSVFIGLLLAILTADFTGIKIAQTECISAGFCRGFLTFLCLIFLIASIVCIIRRIRHKDSLKCGYFIEQLRKSEVNVD